MVSGRVDEDTNYIIETIKAIFDLTLSQDLRVLLCFIFGATRWFVVGIRDGAKTYS